MVARDKILFTLGKSNNSFKNYEQEISENITKKRGFGGKKNTFSIKIQNHVIKVVSKHNLPFISTNKITININRKF